MSRLLFFHFVGIAVITESCVPNSQQSREKVQLIIHHAGKNSDIVIHGENPLVDKRNTAYPFCCVERQVTGPPKMEGLLSSVREKANGK